MTTGRNKRKEQKEGIKGRKEGPFKEGWKEGKKGHKQGIKGRNEMKEQLEGTK